MKETDFWAPFQRVSISRLRNLFWFIIFFLGGPYLVVFRIYSVIKKKSFLVGARGPRGVLGNKSGQ